MDGHIELRLLGATELTDGRRALLVPAPRLRTLLALLAVRGGAGATVDVLTRELGRRPDPTAGRTVRAYLYKLRRQLDAVGWAERLVTTATGYTVRLDRDDLDVARFTRLAEDGLRRLRLGEVEPARQDLAAAVRLWRGQPFADLVPGPGLAVHAQRLHETYVQVELGRVDAELLCGRHHEALPELDRLVAAQPTHEGLATRRIVSLHRAGRRDAALAEYHRIRAVLDEQLGLAPSARLRRLAERIAAPDGSLDWQLLRVDHRPDGDQGCVLARRVPGRTTALSGRTQEVSTVVDALGAPAPVVALHGPAGTGKTALALEAARRVADRFPHGQLVVDLAGRPTEAVLRDLLTALEAPATGVDAAELAAAFRTWTADRRLLLVLDDAVDAAQVRLLLPGGAGSATLVTSVAPLRGLPGGTGFPVDPLAPADAVRALARLTGPAWSADRAAVARVAEHCDGLPRALAEAARLAQQRGLSAERLAALLADDGRRWRLLYAGVEPVGARVRATWAVLPEDGRATWRRLAARQPTLPADALDPADPVIGRLRAAGVLRELAPAPGGVRRFRLLDAARLHARAVPPN